MKNVSKQQWLKQVEQASAKARNRQLLNDDDLVVLALKHLVRDTVYQDNSYPQSVYFTPDFSSSYGFVPADLEIPRNKKVLLIAFGQLGDTVWVGYLIRFLKLRYPACRLCPLIWDKGKAVLPGNLGLDKEFVVEKDKIANLLAHGDINPALSNINSVINDLRKQDFDIVINLKRMPLASIFARLVKAPVNYGQLIDQHSNLITVGNIWAVLLQNEGFEKGKWLGLHRVEQMLRLVEAEKVSSRQKPYSGFWKDKIEDRTFRNKFGLATGERFYGIQVGSRMPTKTWDPEKIAALVRKISLHMQAKVLLCGAKKDAKLAAKIETLVLPYKCINLVGKTSILELKQAIKLCRCFITTDTGPKHIAASLGVPVVEISTGEDSLYRVGPYAKECLVIKAQVSCKECLPNKCLTHDCIKRISADAVFQAMRIRDKITSNPSVNIAVLRNSVKSLLDSPVFSGVSLYYSGKKDPAYGWSYHILTRCLADIQEQAQKLINHCYILLWQYKNAVCCDKPASGIVFDPDLLKEALDSYSPSEKKKMVKYINLAQEQIERSGLKAASLINSIAAHTNNTMIKERLLDILDVDDWSSLAVRINWKIFSSQDDLLDFPIHLQKDCQYLSQLIRRIIIMLGKK